VLPHVLVAAKTVGVKQYGRIWIHVWQLMNIVALDYIHFCTPSMKHFCFEKQTISVENRWSIAL
jgi:hypothetical protein